MDSKLWLIQNAMCVVKSEDSVSTLPWKEHINCLANRTQPVTLLLLIDTRDLRIAPAPVVQDVYSLQNSFRA